MARCLVHSVRDCIDLFRAVVPLQHAATLRSVPRLAMLHHNDALYLAHHALLLTLSFREALPRAVGHAASFADLIPPLRLVAETTLVAQLRSQRATVISLLLGLEGRDDHQLAYMPIEGCGSRAGAQAVERSVRRAVHHLGQLRAAWRDVLPSHVFLASMGHLIDVAVALATESVVRAAGKEQTRRGEGSGGGGGRGGGRGGGGGEWVDEAPLRAATVSQVFRALAGTFSWLDEADSVARWVPHLRRATAVRSLIDASAADGWDGFCQAAGQEEVRKETTSAERTALAQWCFPQRFE